MADNHIKFKLGSSFDGGGFEAANRAIKDNNKELQSSIRGLGDLANAVDDISPSAGNAVSAVKGFTAAFVTGGVVGGVIELAIKGISFAVEKGIEKYKEAQKVVEEYATIIKDQLVKNIDDSAQKFKEAQEAASNANKEAKDLLGVLNGEAAREAQNKIYELHIETLNQITDEMSESAKAVILAQEQIEVANIQHAAEIEKLNNAFEYQKTVVESATEVQAAAASNVEKTEQAYSELRAKHEPILAKLQLMEEALIATQEAAKNGTLDWTKAIEAEKESLVAQKRFRDEHANEFKELAEAEKAYTTATKGLTQAQAEVSKAVEAQTKLREEQYDIDLKYKSKMGDLTAKLTQSEAKQQEEIEKTGELGRATEGATRALEEQQAADKKLAESTKKLADKRELATTQEMEDMAERLDLFDDVGYVILDEIGKKLDNIDESTKGTKDDTKRLTKSGGGVYVDVDWHSGMEDISKPKKLDDGTITTFRTYKDSLKAAAEAQKEEIKNLKNEFGTESTDFFRILNTPKTLRNKDEQELLTYWREKLIPAMTEKYGTEITAKFLGDASKHALIKDDLADFFDPNKGSLIRALNMTVEKMAVN